jgi:hypothetical protein
MGSRKINIWIVPWSLLRLAVALGYGKRAGASIPKPRSNDSFILPSASEIPIDLLIGTGASEH